MEFYSILSITVFFINHLTQVDGTQPGHCTIVELSVAGRQTGSRYLPKVLTQISFEVIDIHCNKNNNNKQSYQ